MYASTAWGLMQQFSRPKIDLAALENGLRDEEIETICRELGHRWRERVFGPTVTVRSIVYRGLHPDKSIRSVLTEMAATAPGADPPTDAAWCQARARLPQGLLPALVARSARRLIGRYGQAYRWWGRPVYRFDGTSVSMPDTPDLVEQFGYANTKHGLSRFPVARLGLWVAAGTEGVRAYSLDTYITDERVQFRSTWGCLPHDSICVCDRKFCNFYDLAKLRQRGIAMVTRLHQRRDPAKLIVAGRNIGPAQWRVPLKLAPQLRRQYDDPTLPQTLWVRLIRVAYRQRRQHKTMWLVTTLMDPQQYLRPHIIRLYRDRWGIETRIDMIKTTLAAKVLRSTTADGVRKELAGRLLAYNLVWTLIHQAADHTGTPAAQISFASAVRVTVAFSIALRGTSGSIRRWLYRRMLDYVAIHSNPYRPGRTEPRLIKRDRRRYGFLKEPRILARLRA